MSSIKISCIIPTIGRGQVLCDTIRMLLDQAVRPHEVIVVDQTISHDNATKATLDEWVRAGLIKLIRRTVPNASAARNAAALAATGDVLLFLDDDIIIDKDFTQSYSTAFADVGTVGVAGQVLERGVKPSSVIRPKAFNKENGWLYFSKNYSRRCETSFMMAGNFAVLKDVYIALGGMDENYRRGAYREESDFAMRFRAAGYIFRYEPACSIHHLGPSVVPKGGARSWNHDRDFHYFHHCVGDWYFNLRWINANNYRALLWASLRHFVINWRTQRRPWRLPFALFYWLAAAPVGFYHRLAGAKLIRPQPLEGPESKTAIKAK